jgi:hypothetical protein
MPVQRIGSLLGTSGELQALSGKVRRLMELQRAFSAIAPPELAAASRVKYCRTGTLFVVADNPAVAAKLRQLAPRLLLLLQKLEAQVTGIHIGVQVKIPDKPAATGGEKTALPVETIKVFEKLAERVPDSALKLALTNLVRHHRGK